MELLMMEKLERTEVLSVSKERKMLNELLTILMDENSTDAILH